MNQELSKIESYSKAFTEKVSNSFFSANDAFTADKILNVTLVDQVNLFIAKNLFQRWQEETIKLKSPYFNFDSEQVKMGLSEFMNVLSRNIYIKKEFFKPLCEKAALDTLLLVLNPLEYFKHEFLGKNYLISDLKSNEKYYKAFRDFWAEFFQKNSNISQVKGEEIVIAFETYLPSANSMINEIREKYLVLFSNVLVFEMPEAKLESPAPAPIEKPISSPQSTIIEKDNSKVEKDLATLNEKFSSSQLTLNDMLSQSSNKTIADQIGKSKIQELKSAISLSQKFLFINALFGGVASEYENALSDLDKSDNYENALQVLSNNYGNRFNWDLSKPEVKEFVGILQRKFS